MNFKGHITGGIIVGLITAVVVTPIGFIPAVVGALYPDMDIRSTSRKIVTPIGIIGVILFLLLGYQTQAIIVGCLTIIPYTLPHRGFTHSILGNLIVSSAVGFITSNTELGVAMAIGMFTHTLLDLHFRIK